jgi:hypothetical protein
MTASNKEDPREWTPISREDCPNVLYERLRKDAKKNIQELKEHFDTKLEKVPDIWKISIRNRMHSALNSVAIILLFISMILLLTSC